MPFLAAVLIGTAVAGGVATMARGNAEAAAAEQRNQQAYQNWLFQLRETGTYNAALACYFSGAAPVLLRQHIAIFAQIFYFCCPCTPNSDFKQAQ